MKKIMILALILTGCDFEAHISKQELEQLNHTCDKNGGFYWAAMTETISGINEIHCEDGATFKLKNINVEWK